VEAQLLRGSVVPDATVRTWTSDLVSSRNSGVLSRKAPHVSYPMLAMFPTLVARAGGIDISS
jgi:hypothetical protein